LDQNIEIIDYHHDYFQHDGQNLPYLDLFNDLEMVSMHTFHIRDLTTCQRHPVAIQLMVLAYKDDDDDPDSADDWIQDILSSYDINICKGSYCVDERCVTFPTDSNIFHYVLSHKFYYHLQTNNRNMLCRIKKYQRRGFHFAGYYDSLTDAIQLMSLNIVVEAPFIDPDHYFLEND
jgi:hypothetical protein